MWLLVGSGAAQGIGECTSSVGHPAPAIAFPAKQQRGAFGIIVPGGSERCTQPVLACHMSLLSPAHVVDRVSGAEPAILDCDDWSSVRCSVCLKSTSTDRKSTRLNSSH